PGDQTVQRLAAAEESHLRELIKLDPGLARLGYWLARALQHARARGARLVLRTGGRDLLEGDAAEVGTLLLRAIDVLPPEETLVATFFEVAAGLRVSLVARAPYLSSLAQGPGRRLSRQLLEEQEMVEMTVERQEQGAFTS